MSVLESGRYTPTFEDTRGCRAPAEGRARELRRREAGDQLGGLDWHVELGAVAHFIELDPIRVRQPLAAEAGRGRRPRQQAVLRPPHDPDRARDPLGLDPPAVSVGVLD